MVVPTRMVDPHEIAKALCETVAGFHRRGWCLGTSGNFSVTLQGDPLQLLITASGREKDRLEPDDLLLVGEDGAPVEAGALSPSAEVLVHCTLAGQARAGSVLHTHSVPNTLLGERFLSSGGFTMSGYEMLKGLEGVRTHEAGVFVPVLANTQEMRVLGREVRRLLRDRPGTPGFLIAGHGLYTWGENLDQARRHVEIFEFLFECLARRTRFEPFEGGLLE